MQACRIFKTFKAHSKHLKQCAQVARLWTGTPIQTGVCGKQPVQTSTMVIFFQRWDGDIIFSGHHCHRWFSNGFVTYRPSPLNVFSQVNHWKRWFFDGFPNFGYNGYQWFRSWKKGNIVAFQTFEILQQFQCSVILAYRIYIIYIIDYISTPKH